MLECGMPANPIPPAPSAPLAPERQQAILRHALGRRVLRVKDLAQELGVHEMTVRRDLDALAEQGMVERVHGGARLVERASEEIGHHLRAISNIAGKEAIARAALALVQDRDTVAFDASTTALALAHIIHARRVSAIVTGLDAANALASTGVPFAMAGGNFHAPARSFVGAFFLETMARLHPDKVFFSAKAFAPETGFTDPHLPEVGAKQALLHAGGMRIALIDATKFGRRALATIATADEVDVVVTDRTPPGEIRAALDAAEVRLIVAEP